jgi:hypothetical protein
MRHHQPQLRLGPVFQRGSIQIRYFGTTIPNYGLPVIPGRVGYSSKIERSSARNLRLPQRRGFGPLANGAITTFKTSG